MKLNYHSAVPNKKVDDQGRQISYKWESHEEYKARMRKENEEMYKK